MFSKADNDRMRKTGLSDKICKLFEKRREEQALKQAEIDGDFYLPSKLDIVSSFSEAITNDNERNSILQEDIGITLYIK